MDEKIVPPNQAELIVESLRKKGRPIVYLPFKDEQHGFRQAKNVKRSLETELFFYSRIFGFTPANHIEPVKIENLSLNQCAHIFMCSKMWFFVFGTIAKKGKSKMK